jgi:hypothetical protein
MEGSAGLTYSVAVGAKAARGGAAVLTVSARGRLPRRGLGRPGGRYIGPAEAGCSGPGMLLAPSQLDRDSSHAHGSLQPCDVFS